MKNIPLHTCHGPRMQVTQVAPRICLKYRSVLVLKRSTGFQLGGTHSWAMTAKV